jgi:hypothetical protein
MIFNSTVYSTLGNITYYLHLFSFSTTDKGQLYSIAFICGLPVWVRVPHDEYYSSPRTPVVVLVVSR